MTAIVEIGLAIKNGRRMSEAEGEDGEVQLIKKDGEVRPRLVLSL